MVLILSGLEGGGRQHECGYKGTVLVGVKAAKDNGLLPFISLSWKCKDQIKGHSRSFDVKSFMKYLRCYILGRRGV